MLEGVREPVIGEVELQRRSSARPCAGGMRAGPGWRGGVQLQDIPGCGLHWVVVMVVEIFILMQLGPFLSNQITVIIRVSAKIHQSRPQAGFAACGKFHPPDFNGAVHRFTYRMDLVKPTSWHKEYEMI